jgi:hypothetical protein
LIAWFTALSISWRLSSETMSKELSEGMLAIRPKVRAQAAAVDRAPDAVA